MDFTQGFIRVGAKSTKQLEALKKMCDRCENFTLSQRKLITHINPTFSKRTK